MDAEYRIRQYARSGERRPERADEIAAAGGGSVYHETLHKSGRTDTREAFDCEIDESRRTVRIGDLELDLARRVVGSRDGRTISAGRKRGENHGVLAARTECERTQLGGDRCDLDCVGGGAPVVIGSDECARGRVMDFK